MRAVLAFASIGTAACVWALALSPRFRGPETAPSRSRNPAKAQSAAVERVFATSCRLSNWVGLGKCRKGMREPGCQEGYDAWFEAGCICDYSAYPWGFLPKDITPIGFTWALMKTKTPHPFDRIATRAPCLEQRSDCRPARQGDVRLDLYGHGTLYMYYEQAWLRVMGRLSNATAMAQCHRLGVRSGRDVPRSSPPRRAAAWRSSVRRARARARPPSPRAPARRAQASWRATCRRRTW
jgi:hypothetical protein